MKLAMLKQWKNDAADKKQGFRVCFEIREGGVLKGDYTPDREEEALETVGAAWGLADEIHRCAPDNVVNIYVVDSQWKPVDEYRRDLMRKYPA